MENATSRNTQIITIGDPLENKTHKLEGRLGIFASDVGISIISLQELKTHTENDKLVIGYELNYDKFINIIFYPNTSTQFIKNIARDIRNVLAHDNNVHITIAKIKNATEDFMQYIKGEIGTGKLNDELYVLDLGTGIYITNEIKVKLHEYDKKN